MVTGIRYSEQFIRLRDYLRAFPDLELTTEDYELAAEFSNTCRSNGVQGSNTDFLLCAVDRSYPVGNRSFPMPHQAPMNVGFRPSNQPTRDAISFAGGKVNRTLLL